MGSERQRPEERFTHSFGNSIRGGNRVRDLGRGIDATSLMIGTFATAIAVPPWMNTVPAWSQKDVATSSQRAPPILACRRPAAVRAASTGRTHDRTRPMLHQRKKALVNQAPPTHDPQRN